MAVPDGHPQDHLTRSGRVLTYVVLGLWSLICIVPIYWAVIASIKAPVEFVGASHYLPFVDFEPSLHAWRQILIATEDNTLFRFINSLAVGARQY